MVRTVLVVGAGVAGSTAAYWLARHGLAVTVVERAEGARSSGSPVDVRGPALGVVERMGVLPRLRDAATQATGVSAVDGRGRRIGWAPVQLGDGIEVPRSDLAAILADRGRDAAEFLYGDTVTALVDDGRGVDVTFERNLQRRFDLVIGADGLHSRVREIAFGAGFIEHGGMYVATVDGVAADDAHTVLMHNRPGRVAAVHPVRGRGGAAFIFCSPQVPGLDRSDSARQRDFVAAAYDGMGWRVPELVERLRTADDVYFDAVARVRMARWSAGRTVLLGDAASCVSLLGEGSSLAIAGAATLAHSVAAHRTDPATALRVYEQEHRRLVMPRQRGVWLASHLLVPATATGIGFRNIALRATGLGYRLFSPPASASPGRSRGRAARRG